MTNPLRISGDQRLHGFFGTTSSRSA